MSKTANKNRKLAKRKVVNSFPPSIDLAPVQTMTFRYIASGATTSTTVFRRNLLCLIMSQSVTLVLGSVFESVRLKKIELWGASATSDINYSTVGLEWEDPRGNSKIITDSGTINRPAHLVCKPPKESTVAMWSNFTTTYVNEPLWFMTFTAGTICDITINFIIGNGTTNNASYITRTTANTALGMYYLFLDNSSSVGGAGTTTWSPPPSVTNVVPSS